MNRERLLDCSDRKTDLREAEVALVSETPVPVTGSDLRWFDWGVFQN